MLPLVFLLACDDLSLSFDTGADTGPIDTAPPADTGPADTAPPEPALREHDDPCQGAGTPYAVYAEDAHTAYVGCGNGAGLHATTDGGATFRRLDRGDMYVFQIAADADGLLVCGHDYASADSTLLYRYDGALRSLLRYGNNATDPGAVFFSNCGAVASDGAGRLMAASNTAGDITWSDDGGVTWAKEERYWEDANLEPDGYAYYYMLGLLAAGGDFFGAGSRIVEPPVLFGPSTHAEGTWANFHAWVVDPGIAGEVWAMATPDDGATIFVGGRDQMATSVASGFLYRTDDRGQTWERIPLPDTLDILQEISFAPDGRHGVAVGSRYPISYGGYVLTTADGGATWTEQPFEVPPLQTAHATDDGWWVAGDYYLASAAW